MTKKHTLVIVTAAFSISTQAQNYVTPVRSDVTPPSPQSAAIVAVQSPEPDLLTGAVNIDIPIYTIQTDGYTLPVTLKYHTNGIKVFDDPAPLGYGWTLQPALRATRTVLGRPDELYPFLGNPNDYEDTNAACYMSVVKDSAFSDQYKDRYDSEHDMFTFALPDKSITRVLDFSGNYPVFIGAGDDEYLVTSDNALNTITVTDPRGNRFLFGGTCEMSPDNMSGTARSVWALDKIVLDNGRVIDFDWSLRAHPFYRRTWMGGYTFFDRRYIGEIG